MKRAWICSWFAVALVAVGCGNGDENNASNNTTTTNNSTTTNNDTTGTNSGTNNTVAAPVCSFGEFLATCGGGAERTLSSRAVGCTEYYEPSMGVQQADLCDDIWDEMNTCSNEGLSGRRPVGCCWEEDEANQLFSRHCYYDDPANLEASGETAQAACEDAGFCWQPAEMM